MELLLSIETAEKSCSVAIHKKGKLIALASNHLPSNHSNFLMPMIEFVIKQGKLTSVKELQGIAVSSGPGSYTGLRVGISTAKGLSYGLGKIPLVAVPTLNIMIKSELKRQAKLPGYLCALMDARRGKAYCLFVDMDGRHIETPTTCSVDSKLLQSLSKGNPLYCIGSGAENYAEKLKKDRNIHIIKGIRPSARDMGSIAYQKWLSGEHIELDNFEPTYLSAHAY